LPCSSVVEQVAVNHLVAGSSPAGAAITTIQPSSPGRLFYVQTKSRTGLEPRSWFDEAQRRWGLRSRRATPRGRARATSEANPAGAAITTIQPSPPGRLFCVQTKSRTGLEPRSWFDEAQRRWGLRSRRATPRGRARATSEANPAGAANSRFKPIFRLLPRSSLSMSTA
jgi:hypothetical protein